MLRPPRTLWRLYLMDLLRLVSLTAGVLVTVIAFAGAVKPISDGVLDAADAVKYILLAIPPMLAYALPFAGGFASTLVYHRMATDLEATAAYASGVSHRSLLAPALGLALACAGCLVALNEQVIPRFLERMQRLVTTDVGRLIAQRVERGEGVAFKGVMLHADQVQRVAPAPGTGVLDQLLLTGFAAVLHENNEPNREVAAQRAKVWLVEGEGPSEEQGVTRLIVKLENVTVVLPDRGLVAAAEINDLSWTVPNAFRDNVKFLTSDQMSVLHEHPERMNWIESRRQALLYTLAERRTMELMTAQSGRDNLLRMVDGRGHPVEIVTGQLVWKDRWELLPPAPGKPVEVRMVRVRPSGVSQAEIRTPTTLLADSAVLANDARAETPSQRLVFSLVLRGVRTSDAGGAVLGELSVPGLTFGASPTQEYRAMSSTQLLAAAKPWLERPEPDPLVAKAASELERHLKRLSRDILSKRHERMALAASCLVMILTGAVAALYLSRRQPLAVYLFTFFPALACVVTISGGQQMIVKQGPVGLWLMWAGVGGLAIYTLWMFWRLRRH